MAQKGGQTKTTSVVNMAACLAGQGSTGPGHRPDTQANATYVLLRGETPRRPSLRGADRRRSTDEAIVPTAFEGVELIPAEPALADVNVSLAGGRPGATAAVRDGHGGEPFDVCLIDTGPTRSLLTTNVLNFATR